MKELIKKIEEAEAKGEFPKDLYQQQLDMIQNAHDEFIVEAKEKGYDINSNLKIAEIEIAQFATMRDIAKKLGQPTDKYTNAIKETRIRILGEEAYKEFFSKEDE